jgi:hypothetical protein
MIISRRSFLTGAALTVVVYDRIKDKLMPGFENLGGQVVKNILRGDNR